MTADRPGEVVIRADGLTKRFGSFEALSELDLDVMRGEVHGFLGPNGAGKSTTIRILLGLLRASGGRVELFGRDPWTDALELHRRLAYVPGDVPLWSGLTGGQCIDLLTHAQGSRSAPHREALIERFDLDPSKRAREYSKGNRQKVALVAALAVDVELLILDEPTSGLDPLMEQVFQDVVRERRDEGCTVLLSSHILGEVEALADRVSIIRSGRRVRTGTLADLRRDTLAAVHAVTVDEPGLDDSTPGLSGLDIAGADGMFTTHVKVDSDHLDAAVGELHRAGIHTLTVTPPSLDELFLQNYRADDGELDGDRDGGAHQAEPRDERLGERQDVAP
ncbi:MAG: ABC transporter ATP-binding protein [Actinomycetota bacterium]|nr:ABC transporter ATP-binding protein [Actinomycetota bacterium]